MRGAMATPSARSCATVEGRSGALATAALAWEGGDVVSAGIVDGRYSDPRPGESRSTHFVASQARSLESGEAWVSRGGALRAGVGRDRRDDERDCGGETI